MKIKLDENLPDRLVAVLTGLGHNVDTVRTEQLTGRAESRIGAQQIRFSIRPHPSNAMGTSAFI